MKNIERITPLVTRVRNLSKGLNLIQTIGIMYILIQVVLFESIVKEL